MPDPIFIRISNLQQARSEGMRVGHVIDLSESGEWKVVAIGRRGVYAVRPGFLDRIRLWCSVLVWKWRNWFRHQQARRAIGHEMYRRLN